MKINSRWKYEISGSNIYLDLRINVLKVTWTITIFIYVYCLRNHNLSI